MTDLPISISNVPAKAVAGKPSASAEAAQQDAQDFDNVLARQLAEPASRAEAGASAAKPQPAGEQDSSTAPEDAAADNSLPADMLAVLVAQQQTAQSAGNAQTDDALQPAPNAPAAADPAVKPGKDKGAVLARSSGNIKAAAMPAADAAMAAMAGQTATDASAAPLPGGEVNTANISAPPADAALAKTAKAGPSALHANPALARSGANSGAAAPAMPLSDPGQAIAAAPLLAAKGLPGAAKAADLKDTAAVSSKPALPGIFNGELAAPAPQPGMLQPVASSSPATPLLVSTPLSQAAWGDEFGQKITWMATQRNQSAELHLNPPQLGPLDVTLKMNGDQATATFTSPHAAVRDAIEQAIPRLREMLADSGIMLGNAMVSDQPARHHNEQAAHKTAARDHDTADTTSHEAIAPVETRVSAIRRHNGMVDTFA